MSDEIISKERDTQCSVRSDLSEKMNILSLVVAIGIPLAIGPILCPLGHILLSVCAFMKDTVSGFTPKSHQRDASDARNTVMDYGLNFGFTLVREVYNYHELYARFVFHYLFSGISHFLSCPYVCCWGLSGQFQDSICIYVFEVLLRVFTSCSSTNSHSHTKVR